MNQRLKNKIVFITGGGSWIGKAIATLFAAEGAKIFIVGREQTKLEKTVAEIKMAGGVAAFAIADISQEQQVQQGVQAAIKHYGTVDILVQNAAIYPNNTIEKMKTAEWSEVLSTNLTGSFLVTKAVIETMKKNNSGKIIFISSIAGETIGLADYSHYAASKAGVNGLMRSAALELAKYHINVNSIAPGNILNQERFPVPGEQAQKMLRKIPLNRFGKPADVAQMALFLASDESSFITGQNFIVDGGETILA